MTASLQQRYGKYYIFVRYKDEIENRWKTKSISTQIPVKGNNKRRAEQELQDVLSKMQNQTLATPTNDYFVDLLKSWLSIANVKVDKVTYDGYKHTVDKHLIPYFSEKKLKAKDVTSSHIQKYYADKMARGRLDGKGGLSAKSIKQHHAVLSQVFSRYKKQLIGNPMEDVVCPSPEPFKSNFLNAKEAAELMFALEEEMISPIIKLTIQYGLRRSEVLGLKWDAVDFENETIEIKHTVVHGFSLHCKDKTKNKSSRRTYPMVGEVKSILLKLKSEQEKQKALYGTDGTATDYVFIWPDGHIIRPDYVSRKFSSLLIKHGFRHVRFHDLRHSCASILIAMGYSLKDVQEWLGHADIKMTEMYSHLEVKRKREMGNLLAENFNKAGKNS